MTSTDSTWQRYWPEDLGDRIVDRPILISTGLPAHEIEQTIRWDGDTAIGRAHFHGHTVELTTWVAHPPPRAPRPQPAGAEPASPAPRRPVRYVSHRSEHWGEHSFGTVSAGEHSADLPAQQIEEQLALALSDFLCGGYSDEVVPARFGGSPMNYQTRVARFPSTTDGDRNGLLLLNRSDDSLTLRVVGECRSYTAAHSYDASASGGTPGSSIDSLDREVEWIVGSLIAGTPAPYAAHNDVVLARGPYRATRREMDDELHLSPAERFIARRLADLADVQAHALTDLLWAQSGPNVWPGAGRLHQERDAAAAEESQWRDELRDCGAAGVPDDIADEDDLWLFRPELSYWRITESAVVE